MKKFEGIPCQFCGEGVLHREIRDIEYEYKGHNLLIEQSGTHCNSCDEAILEPEDLKFNRQALQTFRSRIDMGLAE